MNMKSMTIDANNISISPNGIFTASVDLDMEDSEFYSILDCFSIEEIVENVGTVELLEKMDTDTIISYLNDIGVKTEWEE
nr:MAG TPA: hypothetical protein [Caudoviricetes sp.]